MERVSSIISAGYKTPEVNVLKGSVKGRVKGCVKGPVKGCVKGKSAILHRLWGGPLALERSETVSLFSESVFGDYLCDSGAVDQWPLSTFLAGNIPLESP
jgi:hypothetical protein